MLLDITNRMCAEIELQDVNKKIDSVVNDEIVTEKVIIMIVKKQILKMLLRGYLREKI